MTTRRIAAIQPGPKPSLSSDGPGWIAAILLVVITSAWLGFFSYKHVEYSRRLWWHFQFRADAPRFLRASVGVVGLLLLFSIGRLLRPAAPEPDPPADAAIDRAAAIVDHATQADAHLALARGQAAASSARAGAPSSCTASRGGAGSPWATPSAPNEKRAS